MFDHDPPFPTVLFFVLQVNQQKKSSIAWKNLFGVHGGGHSKRFVCHPKSVCGCFFSGLPILISNTRSVYPFAMIFCFFCHDNFAVQSFVFFNNALAGDHSGSASRWTVSSLNTLVFPSFCCLCSIRFWLVWSFKFSSVLCLMHDNDVCKSMLLH